MERRRRRGELTGKVDLLPRRHLVPVRVHLELGVFEHMSRVEDFRVWGVHAAAARGWGLKGGERPSEEEGEADRTGG